MSSRALAAAAVVAAIALTAAGSADAKVFCAGSPSGVTCEEGHPATGAGLQTALDAADTNLDIDGGPDTVAIGPGFFELPAGFKTGGDDVSIIGSGPGNTVLRATNAADPNKIVLEHKPAATVPAMALRGVRIDLVGPAASGVHDVMDVSDVVVTGSLAGDATIKLPPGGDLTRAVIAPTALANTTSGVFVNGGTVQNTLIRVAPGPGATAVRGVSAQGSSTLRHVTIIGNGGSGTEGALVQAVGTDVDLQVRDSVITNVATPLRRFQTGTGQAVIGYRYTWVDPTRPFLTEGAGVITAGPGNPAGDPKLNSEGIPQAGSVLIDRGDPAAPQAGDSATDVRDGARIQNGRRDIGAYETRPGTTQPPPGGASAADRTAPRITRLKLKRRKGTLRISFRLSEAARVKFTFERKGRRKRKTVYKRKGSFTKTRKAGANTVVFKGKIGRKRLPRGRYRLTVVATDKARNKSRPARARLKTLFPPGK